MRKPKSKQELIAELQYMTTEKHFVRGCKVGMMILFYILLDAYKWEPEALKELVAGCEAYLKLYETGDISIEECDRILREEAGVDFLGDGK